jgi:hypothetical protein
MALPGGFNQTDFMARFGGVPTDYQVTGYLTQIGASGGQVSALTTHMRAQHAGLATIDKIRDWLGQH